MSLSVAQTTRSRLLARILAGAALVAMLGCGLVFARLYPDHVAALAGAMAHTRSSLGVTGWLIAACVQIVIALFGILPASVGGLAMGAAYGVTTGFLLAGTATIIGAVLAFLLGRTLFRPWATSWLSGHPRMARLDEAVCREGWRLVALMRLSPVMPFAMTSYALGLTSLSLRAYLIGTLASLPALLGYVAIGHFAGIGIATLSSRKGDPLSWTILVVAIGATALLTFRLAHILRQIMRLPAS